MERRFLQFSFVLPGVARLRSYPYWQESILAGLLGVLLVTASQLEPGLLGWDAQMDLSRYVWELALLAVPMTLIVVMGGIDLSVGSTMALCAVVLGLGYEAGMSVWLASGAALAAGLAAGALNGCFVGFVRVHPLIVTLATLAAYRGFAEGISQGRSISRFPEAFAFVGAGQITGVALPVAAVVFALVAAVGWLVLSRTTLGRSLYAIGHNETAARFSGIAVDRIKLLLYTISGGVAGLAAVIFASRMDTAKADIATGMELEVITAVLLGGASIFGGRGHILGTVLGVALIHEARQFAEWHWNRNEFDPIALGLLLIGSVLLNRGLQKETK